MEWHDRIRQARDALVPKFSQRRLADAVGVSQGLIYKIESGEIQGSEYLGAIVDFLQLDRSLFPPEAFEPPSRGGKRAQKNPPQQPPDFARDPAYWAAAAGLVGDVPLYASAEGGSGSLIIERDAIGAVKRPPVLQGVRDGYAIRLVGLSMVPEFEPNDTLFVNPRWPVSAKSPCVFYKFGDGDPLATVKRYISETQEEWFVEQHNPAKKFPLERAEWAARHCIVSKIFPGS